MFSKAELAEIVDHVIAEKKQSVDKLGRKAFGTLMRDIMKEVRGKADPSDVSALLKEKLR
ncbi:MAG: GatB/YqeY domain-containing protein [Candidatus Bathyarchaeia archaeon]